MHTLGYPVGRHLAQSLYGLAICQTLIEVALDVADQFNHRRFDGFDFRTFRFGEPDCSSGNTLVAGAALGAVVGVCRFIVMVVSPSV